MAAARWDSEHRMWQGFYLLWDLWYGCDYHCPYCWFEMRQDWAKLADLHLGIPVERWLQGWRRLHEAHGCAAIEILGGEPLRYPGALELLSGLAQWHRFNIVTNLSVPLEFLKELTARVSPERMHLDGSYHPAAADWDEFAPKVALLKSLGYEPEVRMVAWPPHLKAIQEKKGILAGMGVRAVVQVFQGGYQGREYPRAYTEAERAVLAEMIPGIEWECRRQEQPTLGKLCGAGHIYANVKANGDVFRCAKESKELLGNILDEGFRLHERPQPCPYEFCNPCGENIFLWDDWAKMAATVKGSPVAATAE